VAQVSTREVEVHMKWSETITVEVPADWPEVNDLDDLPFGTDIRPFDPATVSVDIDDDGPA
jgi:hypothetical protein